MFFQKANGGSVQFREGRGGETDFPPSLKFIHEIFL